ncbi:MAG: shikimate dehydrogenase [Candidatus Hodarchaeota archaeon]
MCLKTVVCISGDTPQKMIELIRCAESKTENSIFEIRADYLQKSDLTYQTLKMIRNTSREKLIFTLRKKEEGGMIDIDDRIRKILFLDAIALDFDYIDVEFSSSKELLCDLLENRGSSSVILSHHNFDRTDRKDIQDHYIAMQALNPDIIKIVTMAGNPKDNNVTEDMLIEYAAFSPPLVCFCMGQKGKRSRISGYGMGNALTYLALDAKSSTASGQLTYNEFQKLRIEINQRTCAVIGSPISHSMSPVIHNAAFRKLELKFYYRAMEVKNSKDAIDEMLENGYRGYSVTLPHKVEIMKYLDEIDPLSEKIGAVNTVVNDNGCLKGYNTDVIGALKSINDVINIEGRRIVILGAGGAARAIGFGLKDAGVDIFIQNRTLSNAKTLAGDLNCSYSTIDPQLIKDYDLIVNTTPVGMHPDVDKTIIEDFPENCTVMDIVYNPVETKLLKLAKAKNCKTINGLGMFVYQAAEQFRLFTGKDAPVEIMRKVVRERLS